MLKPKKHKVVGSVWGGGVGGGGGGEEEEKRKVKGKARPRPLGAMVHLYLGVTSHHDIIAMLCLDGLAMIQKAAVGIHSWSRRAPPWVGGVGYARFGDLAWHSMHWKTKKTRHCKQISRHTTAQEEGTITWHDHKIIWEQKLNKRKIRHKWYKENNLVPKYSIVIWGHIKEDKKEKESKAGMWSWQVTGWGRGEMEGGKRLKNTPTECSLLK